eukprot:727637-Pelagomonas_calceolata.AAC.1
MLDENVSPAADQPDFRAVGQPLVTPCSDVPTPRSALSVRSVPHYQSTAFSFLRLHVSHRMPCLGTIHHVNSQDMINFLNQDNNRLPFFLHDLM